MLEKNYYAATAYTPENSCEYIDTLLSLLKYITPDTIDEVVESIDDFDFYEAGIIDGITMAISAFGEVHGVIPYSNEEDGAIVDLAIKNGKNAFEELTIECEHEDECEQEDECDCGCDDEPLINIGVDQETFDKISSILAALIPSV